MYILEKLCTDFQSSSSKVSPHSLFHKCFEVFSRRDYSVAFLSSNESAIQLYSAKNLLSVPNQEEVVLTWAVLCSCSAAVGHTGEFSSLDSMVASGWHRGGVLQPDRGQGSHLSAAPVVRKDGREGLAAILQCAWKKHRKGTKTLR